MSDDTQTPVMLTSQMKPMLAKDFCHDAKGRERAAATYISGLWVHNDDGRMVVRFDDRDGENHYMGKSRVETALKKASISFEQVEVKNAN